MFVYTFRSELFNPLNEGTVMGIPSNLIVPEYFKEPSYIYSINQLKQGNPVTQWGSSICKQYKWKIKVPYFLGLDSLKNDSRSVSISVGRPDLVNTSITA